MAKKPPRQPKPPTPRAPRKVSIYLTYEAESCLEARRNYILGNTECTRADVGLSRQIHEAIAIAFPTFWPKS